MVPASIAALLAVLIGVLAGPADGQTETGFLATVNASTETIDVYIDGQLASIRLEPGETGREFSLPAGAHTVQIYPAGLTARAANLLAESEIDVLSATGTSAVAWGSADTQRGITLEGFANPAEPEAGEGCLALRHLAEAGPTRLLIDGAAVGDTVGEGSSTRSISVLPGRYDLGLEGIDTTPAQVEITAGSCAVVHAAGSGDVIVNLVLQEVRPRGDADIEAPPATGPADVEVINGLRGLAVDFVADDETLPLAPLSSGSTTAGPGPVEARFIDRDGNEIAATTLALEAGQDVTVTLHGGADGTPMITTFDNSTPTLDEGAACVDVRILAASADPADVAVEDGPAQVGLAAGDTTGPLSTRPGATAITAGPAEGGVTTTHELDEGSCLRLYLVDTADGLQIATANELEAGLVDETEADVAGAQETLPVTGRGDGALPMVLFALGVIVFGIGLTGRSREHAEMERTNPNQDGD